MKDKKHTVILEIVGEGGSLTLFEVETSEGRHYEVATVNDSLALIDEGQRIEGIIGTSTTWSGALKLLDTYPWHMLSALSVHPDFTDRVWQAAKARLAKTNSSYAESRMERWREKCHQPEAK